LLKAGLVDEQKLKQARTSKRKKTKQAGGKDQAAIENRRRAEQAAAEKARRDRELNRQRQEEAKRRAEENELRQYIHTHRILRGEGHVAYNFQDGDSLKRIYVTAEQQRGLAGGKLGLVRQDAGYELVPAEIAEKIAGRKAALILVLNRPGEGQDADAPEEDDYADFKVPDDLMW
jgi:uncharacterized protein YaiL (DUF2058 family)